MSMPCRCHPAPHLLREGLETAEDKTQAWPKVRETQAQRGAADELRLRSWGQKTSSGQDLSGETCEGNKEGQRNLAQPPGMST